MTLGEQSLVELRILVGHDQNPLMGMTIPFFRRIC
jgi:hypothetical protein